MSLSKTIAVRKTLSDMVKDRNEAIRLWSDGYRLMDKAKDICNETAHYGGPPSLHEVEVGNATQKIDSMFWRQSFERTGMMQIMDAKASKEFQNSLEREPPVFSMDNIEVQYLTMYQEAEMMFQRGIYEVFMSLDHSYWNNNHEPYEISDRNILRGILDSWSTESSWSKPRLSYYKTDWINDVDRCVKVLTGRKHEPRELETKINTALLEQSEYGPPWIYEDSDYHMKFFKNCNCHLVFKNQDTIDRLNREIAAYCNHHRLAEAA
jgi:hypothetical protein